MLVVIAGPSGSGKSTLAEQLIKKQKFNWLLSYTTRPRRSFEKDGEYRFLDDKTFDTMRDNGEFLWHEQPFKSMYRYASRVHDIDTALAGDDAVALLIGSSLFTLYGYSRRLNDLEEACFLYLKISDQAELRRRLDLDKNRSNVEERLASALSQNQEAERSYLPYHFIDATMPLARVYETAVAIINEH